MRLQDIREGRWVQISSGVIRRIGRVVDRYDCKIKLCFDGSTISHIFNAGQVSLWKAVDVTPAPKPVSGTVAIIKDVDGVYRAEEGRLLISGQQLDEKCIPSGSKIVARLTWTEGDGL